MDRKSKRHMDLTILTDRDLFPDTVVRKLGQYPVDYAERMTFIQCSRETPEPYSAAGVLLLLHFREERPDAGGSRGNYCFQLIKRSASVAQPGDLSCPGGMLHPRLDRILRTLLTSGIVPAMRGYTESFAGTGNGNTLKAITLFLTNAIRESWEEIRLSPFNIRFLGPLPCHSLILFRRTIFPLVGLVKKAFPFRPNGEVERVVEIPLSSFFEADNYAQYLIDMSDSIKREERASWQFPCFLHREEGREPDILWGATFHIILRFLEIVFDFKMPDIPAGRVLRRTLHHTYLTGHK
jgi:8-oxo-dGTP pyrophosphatase MutT (NUDIX family)